MVSEHGGPTRPPRPWWMPPRRPHFTTASTAIQRRLERTSLLAVLLGYALLLAVNLQLFKEQRYQRQLQTMRRAELLLISSAQAPSQAPAVLRRVLSDFSTFDLALWGHPTGFPAGMVMPQPSSNDWLASSPDLRFQAEEFARRRMAPQMFEHDNRRYMLSSTSLDWRGTPWTLYLLRDVSDEVAFQRQLNGLLLLAAVLASLVSILLNRRGIQRGLDPLKRFGDSLESVQSNSLQQQRFQPEQQPQELQPLAMAFNALLDRLADSFERQKQFASTVSHELRNPISLIAGYSRRLLRRSDNLSEDQQHQLVIVEEESRRLGRLVTDLLAITRAEMGIQKLDLQPLCVSDVVLQSIALAEGSGEFRFVYLPPEGLDPADIQALADRDCLVQCLVNLMENACKYSPTGSSVEIGCSVEASQVLLRVRDHGPGVPMEEREQVFERFRRGHHIAEVPGSGIGLAVVQTLIVQMGGTVHVDGADGGGAVFVLGLRRWASPPP